MATNKPKTIRTAMLLGAALVLAPMIAEAQFPGDVFFTAPSVAVPEGGTAELEVLLFSGANVVGAAHFDVVFDPSLAEIVAVEPGATKQLARGHVSAASPGRAAVVDLNGESLTQPFGTSSLARLKIRALAPAGTRIPLSIQVRSLLQQDSTPLPGGRGFGGEIVVVSGSSGVQSSASVTEGTLETGAAVDPALVRRAWEFRRPGQAVDLLELRTRGRQVFAVPQRVVVPDPSVPGEDPER